MSFLARESINEYAYSAENILHHFRCILRGPEPFADAERNPREFKDRAKIDDESMQYVENMVRVLKRRRKSINPLKNRKEVHIL